MDDVADRIARLSPAKRALLALRESAVPERATVRGAEPIAIVGMSCRFPGGADHPESYWRMLREGRDAITDVPPDRWDLEEFYDPNPEAPGKVYTRSGGFLERVDGFDAAFFNVSPREAAKLDPQQRLLLELTWEALEDSGCAPDSLSGSSTGVFVGISTSDYTLRRVRSADLAAIDAYDATGNSFSVAAGRLSYFFGLRGPSLAIDTACSSSLVTVHLACQSLRLGECDRALAGGVNLMLSPDLTINFCKARMLAPDGRCKTFDAAADGYGRGEGGGLIVLKRLADALRDGDNILAVVRGSAINQDGRSAGLTAPNGPAQEAVIRAALGAAGIDASNVDYVEAHGTGTPLGDPIELQVLAELLARKRSETRALLVGSVKTNFGHLEAAAGIAGLIKTVLALGHAEIPAHLHLRTLNEHIQLNGDPVRIPTQLTPWPAHDGSRVAGISAFGFSGTNAHVVLTDAPRKESASATDTERVHLFVLDARNDRALRELAARHAAYLASAPETSLADVCYTSQVGRSRLIHRLATVVTSAKDLAQTLDAFARGELPGARIHTGVSEVSSGTMSFGGEGIQDHETSGGLLEAHPQVQSVLATGNERDVLEAAAALHVSGGNVDWASLHRGRSPRRVPLPTYAWQRERFWLEPDRDPASPISGTTTAEARKSIHTNVPELASETTVFDRDSASVHQAVGFGLMFFSSSDDGAVAEKYRLVIEAAKFADAHGFSSVWVPERHFSRMGYLYPNPAVLHAALARETRHVRLRAGSVVMPLHDPIRVAEEWSVVDNLSQGRVDLSFAAGWHPNDFVFFPERYAERQAETFRGMDIVRKLWRGESIRAVGGDGTEIDVRTYPTPVQPELPVWITAAGNPRTFIRAGESGANLLTHLLDQGVETLAEKIALYRSARAKSGFDPASGHVTVMLHTFVGNDVDRVREEVRAPFCAYLKTLTHLLDGLAQSRGRKVDLAALSPEELDEFVNFLFERFFSTRALLGTPETCVPLVEKLAEIGVDEIACLMDFGPATDSILSNLPHLERLLRHFAPRPNASGNVTRHQHLSSAQARVPALAIDIAPTPRNGAKRTNDESDSDGIGDWLYEMQWEEGAPGRGAEWDVRGDWLILEDDGGVGAALAEALERRGGRCRRVRGVRAEQAGNGAGAGAGGEVWDWRDGPGLEATVRAASAGCRGVVHLWALDGRAGGETTWESVAAEQGRGVESALAVMKGMAAGGTGAAGPRLWVVTRGAQAVGEEHAAHDDGHLVVREAGHEVRREPGRRTRHDAGSQSVSVSQAPLWGLGRTCAMEHPEIWGGLIDLDPGTEPSASADGLLGELANGAGEDQVCLRGARRYVARLVRAPAPAPTHDGVRFANESAPQASTGAETQAGTPGSDRPRPAIVRSDRSYLVTGGLMGLGWEVARWLVSKGARSLVLAGRTMLPDRADWLALPVGSRQSQGVSNLQALERLGAEVTYWTLDVADPAALREKLAQFAGPPIGGVVHAASVWREADAGSLVRPLLQLDAAAVRAVLRPKVLGSWALHEALDGLDLKFFVSFSSAASLLGSAGQGNYAAASAFLDALAHLRRQQGQPGLTINWGAVGGSGFGTTDEGLRVHEYWESRGVGRLSVAQVLEALEWALGQTRSQVGILRLDWPRLRRAYPELARRPWTSAFAAKDSGNGDENGSKNGRQKPLDNGDENGDANGHQNGHHTEGSRANTKLRQALLAAGPADRASLMQAHLTEQVARAIRAPKDGLNLRVPLTHLGLDSLMAIELRNGIEQDVGIVVPVRRFLEEPSIETLSAEIVAQFSADDARTGSASSGWETGEL